MALIYLSTLSVFNSLIIVGSLIFLWYKKKVDNHNYLLWFALFFGYNGLSEFLTNGIVWFLHYSKPVAIINGVFYISTPYFLLRGSYSFANKKMPVRMIWYVVCGGVIIIANEYFKYFHSSYYTMMTLRDTFNAALIIHQSIAPCITIWLFFEMPHILVGIYKYIFLSCLLAWITISAVMYYSPIYVVHVNSVAVIGCLKLFCGIHLIIIHVCRLQLERDQTVLNFYDEHTLLRLIIDNIPDFIYAKDLHGRFILANTSLTKFHKTLLLGKTDFDIHDPEHARMYQQAEQELLAHGVPMINQEEPLCLQGTTKKLWMSVTKLPLRNHQGEVIGIVGINRDITALKQLNDEYQTALAIINWGKQQQIALDNEPTDPIKPSQFRHIIRAS